MTVARFWTITNPEILITKSGGGKDKKPKEGKGGGGGSKRGGGWTGRGGKGGGFGAGGGSYAIVNAETSTVLAGFSVQPDDTRIELMDVFIGQLKSDNLWDILDCLYIMSAHDEQAARVNWKSPGDFALRSEDTGHSWIVDSGFGLDGNGTLNTDWALNTRTALGNIKYNQFCMGIWSGHTGTTAGPHTLMGGAAAGQKGFMITGRKSNNAWQHQGHGNLTSEDGGLDSDDDGGLWHISRTGGGSYWPFRNGVGEPEEFSTAKTPLTTQSVRIGGQNAAEHTIVTKLRAAYFGGKFIAGEDLKMYNAMRTFMDGILGVGQL